MRIVDLSECDATERRLLLHAFYRRIYLPAFPDPNLREDERTWLRLVEERPGPPAPALTLLVALDGGEAVGGAAAEYYRRAQAGLLTYIAVAPAARRTGIGRALVRRAIAAIGADAGFAPVVFAETERLEMTTSEAAAAQIRKREAILDRLGALAARLDYYMPPLEPGKDIHRLRLLAFGQTLPPARVLPAATIAAFVRELAESLGADLDAASETAAMMRRLDLGGGIAFVPMGEERGKRH